MDRTTTLTMALLLALSFATTTTLAAPPDGTACPAMRGGTGGEGPGGPWLARLQALELTAEQRQAISVISDRYRARGTDLAQRASGIREQMLSVSPDDPGYAGATEKSSETAALLAADTVRLLSELRAEVHAVLTADQRRRLREQGQQERQRWDDWRERHKPPQ